METELLLRYGEIYLQVVPRATESSTAFSFTSIRIA